MLLAHWIRRTSLVLFDRSANRKNSNGVCDYTTAEQRVRAGGYYQLYLLGDIISYIYELRRSKAEETNFDFLIRRVFSCHCLMELSNKAPF